MGTTPPTGNELYLELHDNIVDQHLPDLFRELPFVTEFVVVETVHEIPLISKWCAWFTQQGEPWVLTHKTVDHKPTIYSIWKRDIVWEEDGDPDKRQREYKSTTHYQHRSYSK